MNLIFYMRLQRILGSPTSKLVFNPHDGNRFFCWRVGNLDFNLSKVLTVESPHFPPWTNLVKLDQVGIRKGERPEAKIRESFLNTLLSTKDQKQHTDDSKSENGESFAAVSRRKTVVYDVMFKPIIARERQPISLVSKKELVILTVLPWLSPVVLMKKKGGGSTRLCRQSSAHCCHKERLLSSTHPLMS